MFVATGYHLCGRCAQRDWEHDPVVRTAVARNLSAKEEMKASCADCRVHIRVPMFRWCKKCATRERLCQHCGGTTLTEREQTARRLMAEWRASYLEVVRKYGIRSEEAKQHLAGCEDEEVRETLGAMSIKELDWPRPLSGRRA